jgi:arylsulfatase A-like enzyme
VALAACVALGLVALGGWSAGADATTTQAHPNIILVTTDDQPTSMMRGRFMPKAMKQVAGKGTFFTNMVVTTPLCCPSRASMMTGEYGHNNGVLANSYSLLRDKDNVLPSWLQRAGYRTAHVGKFLNGYEAAVGDPSRVAPGWDTWFTVLGATRYFDYDVSANGVVRHFGKGQRNHVTKVLNSKAASLVRRYSPDPQPFYLQLDHRAPHTETGVNSGGRCGARAVPENPNDEKHLRDEPLPNPPSFNEADIADKPSFVRGRALLDAGRIKKMTKRYECAAAALGSVDRGIKQIVTELRKANELDNTVIVFTSDNGYYFGEHRIARDKAHPYEEGIRVPLLIRVPTAYLGGRTPVPLVDTQVANIDLAPTFLQLAGGRACVLENGDEEDELDPGSEDCRVMDGRSMMPLLRGDGGWPKDRGLLIEYRGASSKGESSCEYQGIRVPSRFYVEHVQVPDPLTGICEPAEEVELYDLAADPYQLQNLSSSSPALGESLAERLDLLRGCSGIAGRDPAPAEGTYCE